MTLGVRGGRIRSFAFLTPETELRKVVRAARAKP
jgi:hypothetical protein